MSTSMSFVTHMFFRVFTTFILSGHRFDLKTTNGNLGPVIAENVFTTGIGMCRLKCKHSFGCTQITFELINLNCCLSKDGVKCPNKTGLHIEHIDVSWNIDCEVGSRIVMTKKDVVICSTRKQTPQKLNLPKNRTCGIPDAWKKHKLVFNGLVEDYFDACVLNKLGPNGIDCTDGSLEEDLYEALEDAAYEGNLELFNFLINAGCTSLELEEGVDNILHEACRNGHANIVERILSLDLVDKDSIGGYKVTPILLAAEKGHKDVFDLLAKRGANLNVTDYFNCTLLHQASTGGNVDIVKYIMSLNIIDKESVGFRQETPLLSAVGEGTIEVVDFLVKQGCNFRAVNMYGRNILELASDTDMEKHLLTIPGVAELKHET